VCLKYLLNVRINLRLQERKYVLNKDSSTLAYIALEVDNTIFYPQASNFAFIRSYESRRLALVHRTNGHVL
jgi:hypothetical protein